MANSSKATGEIAKALGLEIIGDVSLRITRISSLHNATTGSISFITDRKKLGLLSECKASALIVPRELIEQGVLPSVPCLLPSSNPYLSYAKLTQFWSRHNAQHDRPDGQVHPSAVIDPDASVAESATIGPGVVVCAGATIAEQVVINAGAVVGFGVAVGQRTTLHANSTIYHDCVIGEDCEVHSGAVIGADGFGFAPDPDPDPDKAGWEKICQLGRVVIGNGVSIGACTCIDRGALDDTVIEDGVILDNQIQVAHNVVIGKNTAIAGCTGIAGSTSIGANCRIGGAVSIVGHITICDGVLVTANSFVNRSIKERGSYSSGVPLQDSSMWRKNAVRLGKLDALSRDFEKLKNTSV